MENRPKATVIFGDINSHAGLLPSSGQARRACGARGAGLRSFDRSMPEEINRVLTDAIADLLLVTEQSGIDNLMREGIANEKMKLSATS